MTLGESAKAVFVPSTAINAMNTSPIRKLCIDISIKKAKTARFFDMPTGDIGKLSQPGGPLYQIEVSNGGLITFPGGVPIKSPDGTIIGAIGVSGVQSHQDGQIAQAGADALK